MAQPWYTTREQVKAALDVAETARANPQVDRAIAAASRTIEGRLHRKFYPQVGTRHFDWPNPQRARPWRLWLDQHELISITSLTAGGVTIDPGDYLLYPDDGPPYSRLEINLGGSAAFSSGATHQKAIAITGVWGSAPDEEQIGTLTSDLDADPADTADVTWTVTDLGVGAILRIGDERLIVTQRTMVDSGQNTTGALLDRASDVTVPVADGSAYAAGQVLLIDSERMLVVDVAGNQLTVKRAWDGSVLASHSSGADVFHLAGVDIARAQLGSSLAAHGSGAAVYRHVVPGPVSALCVGLALAQVLGEQSGYARPESRTGGSGATSDSRRRTTEPGAGLPALWADAYAACGRKARIRGV
jgi:hypothetical protein